MLERMFMFTPGVRIPFSFGSTCRRWPCVVWGQQQEEEGSAEEEDSTRDMGGVVANDTGPAASAEEAVLDPTLVGRHSLDAEGPWIVSQRSGKFLCWRADNLQDSDEEEDKHYAEPVAMVEEDTVLLPLDPDIVLDGQGLGEDMSCDHL